ncbi:hypothetical protein [Hyphomicrobium sp. DMF-1]|uniref:hypothetical protein n=1 Tax=Hyphomicrobium sp. DMF-1 TaxID=3019544 RepID=UPI0022EBACA9|nr:hypothetical protein [Hyphomicrobium sp. DMF-1]WBT39622.1 hypothetical protein PE058_07005 [Hyphomicrobium sp. DMF-1]
MRFVFAIEAQVDPRVLFRAATVDRVLTEIERLPWGALGRWTQHNDISYGTYLYGWPIQQSLMVAFPSISITANMFAALVLAPLAGFASWTAIETKALSFKTLLPARPDPINRQS